MLFSHDNNVVTSTYSTTRDTTLFNHQYCNINGAARMTGAVNALPFTTELQVKPNPRGLPSLQSYVASRTLKCWRSPAWTRENGWRVGVRSSNYKCLAKRRVRRFAP